MRFRKRNWQFIGLFIIQIIIFSLIFKGTPQSTLSTRNLNNDVTVKRAHLDSLYNHTSHVPSLTTAASYEEITDNESLTTLTDLPDQELNGEVTYVEPEQSLAPRTLLYRPDPSHCENRTLFVGVHVRVTAFDVRQEWRDSFGKLREKYNFCLVFGLGLPSNQSDLAKLRNESLLHGDLLIEDFMDTYKNLTHKQLMLLRYFNQELKEVPLFLKIDDDVAVNLEKFQTMVSNLSHSSPTISCLVWVKSKVFRKGHKSAISRKQYPPTRWPNFCSGMAYIFNQKAATIRLDQVQYKHWLHLDGVFITGILAKRANVKHLQTAKGARLHGHYTRMPHGNTARDGERVWEMGRRKVGGNSNYQMILMYVKDGGIPSVNNKKSNFCLVFGLGMPSDQSDLAKLRNESLIHGDLLIGDFMDTYKNLTHKQLMLLRYFDEELKEVSLFLKINDNVAVNLEKLQTILPSADNPEPTVSCLLWQNAKVIRSNHKSAVSWKQYAPPIWPNFCSGMAYFFNQKSVAAILEQVQYEKWLHLDNILITGILAKRAKVKHVQLKQFYSVEAVDNEEFFKGLKIFQLTHRNETKRFFEMVNKL